MDMHNLSTVGGDTSQLEASKADDANRQTRQLDSSVGENQSFKFTSKYMRQESEDVRDVAYAKDIE